MLRGPFLDRSWMAQNPDYDSSDIVMLGLPFDGTVSYRPGSRFAPEQIRLASWGLEEYSPFFDKKGKALNIERLKYNHLSQLIECDEGHHLEYKLNLEDGGKAQLAKEIASFANCEGGWLIIGIDDKTREIRPIDKKDYSQKIGK